MTYGGALLCYYCVIIEKIVSALDYDYTVGLPELVSVKENPAPLIVAIAIFILMILSVFTLYKSNRKLCIELMVLNILGFGSRFMMGFSATIFASSYRTFTLQLALALVAYIFMFITPGHLERMSSTVEMERWFPQYADWTIADKVYHGVTTTFANIFYQRPTLFMWFCYLMVAVVFFENRKKVMIPVALLVTVLACSALDYNIFIRFYDYTVGHPKLVSVKENPAPLIVAIAIFILMIMSVFTLYKSNRKLCIELMVLNILGFGSRFMMGFSATIFASSYRTFTLQLICFLICDVLMVQLILSTSNSEKGNGKYNCGMYNQTIESD